MSPSKNYKKVWSIFILFSIFHLKCCPLILDNWFMLGMIQTYSLVLYLSVFLSDDILVYFSFCPFPFCQICRFFNRCHNFFLLKITCYPDFTTTARRGGRRTSLVRRRNRWRPAPSFPRSGLSGVIPASVLRPFHQRWIFLRILSKFLKFYVKEMKCLINRQFKNKSRIKFTEKLRSLYFSVHLTSSLIT